MSDYWEDREAWDMYNHMKDADETADLIAKIYRNASMQITFAAEDIFERYMTKHKISEREAWELINTMQDRDSIQELILKLKNKDPDKTRQELIRELISSQLNTMFVTPKDIDETVKYLSFMISESLNKVFFEESPEEQPQQA